jgi:hypothetical protein
MIKDKLGNVKSQKTYMLPMDDLRTYVEVGSDEAGIFFNENVYVVDI